MISRRLLIAAAFLIAAVAGLSVYLLHLRRGGASAVRQPIESQTITPVDRTETVPVFLADDSRGVLRAAQLTIPVRPVVTERTREILQAVVAEYAGPHSSHTLASGAAISAVMLVGSKLAVVNLNSALCDGQPSGIGPESLMIASMVDTLSANLLGLEQVRFLVDGKERDTLAGHVDLTRPFSVAAMQQAVPVAQ